MKIKCAYCGEEYKVSNWELLNDKIECPYCGSYINLDKIKNLPIFAGVIIFMAIIVFIGFNYIINKFDIFVTENFGLVSFLLLCVLAVVAYGWSYAAICIWNNKNIKKYNNFTTLFKDVYPGTWYGQAVNNLAKEGIVHGNEHDYFMPDLLITKLDLLDTLSKLDNEDIAKYGNAADWGMACGIVRSPDDVELLRAQAVAMMYKYVRHKGWNFPETKGQDLADISKLNAELHEAVTYCHKIGIIDGGEFRAGEKMTRAEAAVMIMRLREAILVN